MNTEPQPFAETVAPKRPKRPIRRRRTSSTPDRASLKHRPISRIAGLTTDQLDQLAAWHLQDGLSIDACAQRATTEFNPPRPIPKTSVQRFLEHRRTADLLCPLNPNSPSPMRNGNCSMLDAQCDLNPNPVNLDNPVKTSPSAPSAVNPSSSPCLSASVVDPSFLRAATEINQYAATGSTDFSPATLFLLEQKAFQLTHHLQSFLPEKPEQIHQHIRPLKDLCLLINKAKNTAIRERHAAVQEEKCAFRRDELKARRIEVEVRERQRQEQLDLQRDQLQLNRDKFDLQKQQPRKTHNPGSAASSLPTGGTSSASPSLGVPSNREAVHQVCSSGFLGGSLSPMPNENCSTLDAQYNSNLNPVNPVNPVKTSPSSPSAVNDPHAHIRGDNYLDPTNKRVWVLATDTPVLPFTDTAMEHRDRRNPLPPVDHSCTAAVQDFADRVARDYIQYLADPPRPQRPNSIDYDYYAKRVRGCPCGQPKFCDRHIFIALFSYAHPWSHAFRQCLLDRGLPYVPPTIPFPGNKPNI